MLGARKSDIRAVLGLRMVPNGSEYTSLDAGDEPYLEEANPCFTALRPSS